MSQRSRIWSFLLEFFVSVGWSAHTTTEVAEMGIVRVDLGPGLIDMRVVVESFRNSYALFSHVHQCIKRTVVFVRHDDETDVTAF